MLLYINWLLTLYINTAILKLCGQDDLPHIEVPLLSVGVQDNWHYKDMCFPIFQNNN